MDEWIMKLTCIVKSSGSQVSNFRRKATEFSSILIILQSC